MVGDTIVGGGRWVGDALANRVEGTLSRQGLAPNLLPSDSKFWIGAETPSVTNVGIVRGAGNLHPSVELPATIGPNAAFKLSFDPSLNVVDKTFSIKTGELLAENPIGAASYARLQRQGTDVRFVNDPAMEAMGYFDAYANSVTVNMGRHFSAREAASTIVHEATHQNGFYKGKPQNTQFSEYQSFRNEMLFQNGVRPSLAERLEMWNDVQSLYPDLPQGKYPFGGKP